MSVTVTADRKDGFDGAIDVELRDLPAGLTATPGRIPAGAATTVLMLAAAEDASFEGQKAALPSMYPTAPQDLSLRHLRRARRRRAEARRPRDDRRARRSSHEAETTELVSVIALAPKPDLVVTTDAKRIEVIPGQARDADGQGRAAQRLHRPCPGLGDEPAARRARGRRRPERRDDHRSRKPAASSTSSPNPGCRRRHSRS